MYDAYASEMEQTASDEVYLQQHHRSFGSRPIRALTSGNHGVGHLERKPPDTPEHLKYEQETTLDQAGWLSLSSNSKQILARNSSEYIQFDEPDTVINAIPRCMTRQEDQLPTEIESNKKEGACDAFRLRRCLAMPVCRRTEAFGYRCGLVPTLWKGRTTRRSRGLSATLPLPD